jgi:hypothetical protein
MNNMFFYINYILIPTLPWYIFYFDACPNHYPAEVSTEVPKNVTLHLSIRTIKRSPLIGNRIPRYPYKQNNTLYSTIPETQTQIQRDSYPIILFLGLHVLPVATTINGQTHPWQAQLYYHVTSALDGYW